MNRKNYPSSQAVKEIAAASIEYYSQLQNPTMDEFCNWINSLQEPMKSVFLEEGFNPKNLPLPFQLHALENRGFSRREFMKSNLSPAAFSEWCKS